MKNLSRFKPVKGLSKKGQQGFTLIELVMVIVVIGIMSAIALPRFVDLSGSANTAAAKAGFASAQTALTTSIGVNSETNPSNPYPTLSQVASNVNGGRVGTDAAGVCVAAGYRADTFTDEAGTAATSADTDIVKSLSPTGTSTADAGC